MTRSDLKATLATCATALVLASCGRQAPDSAASVSREEFTSPVQRDAIKAPEPDRGLSVYAGKNICRILDKETLISLFSPQAPVETRSHVNKRGASCTWTWSRPDARERQQAMVQAMMERMKSGKSAKKRKMSAYSPNYTVRVELQDSTATARSFVPRKLSESELQEQISEVNKRTRERLTDKQQQLAKKSGLDGMAGRLLRKSNEREVVGGVGDAAYWVPVSNGSLRVLHGNKAIVIASSIADNKEDSIDIAKRIYAAIIQ